MTTNPINPNLITPNPIKPNPIKPKAFKARLLIQVALLLILALWSFLSSVGAEYGDRVITSRYFMMGAAALYAFLTPYLLFPDSRLPLYQLGNTMSAAILKHLLGRSSMLCLVPLAVTLPRLLTSPESFADSLIYAIQAILFLGSLWIIAVFRYLKTGERSQFWKESERGQILQQRLTVVLKTPVDAGSLPTLLETILITSMGMLIVAVGALLTASAGIYAGLFPAILLLTYAIWLIFVQREALPQYYRTNAFFREYFRTGLDGKEDPVSVNVEELWWVPRNLRADLLPVLMQMDRKIPSSRWIYAGHGVMWILALQQPGRSVMLAAWALFLVVHHIPMLITSGESILPAWFARWLGSPFHWIAIRFWIQMRWLLLIVVSIFLQQMIFGESSVSTQDLVVLLTGYLSVGAFAAYATGHHLLPSKSA